MPAIHVCSQSCFAKCWENCVTKPANAPHVTYLHAPDPSPGPPALQAAQRSLTCRFPPAAERQCWSQSLPHPAAAAAAPPAAASARCGRARCASQRAPVYAVKQPASCQVGGPRQADAQGWSDAEPCPQLLPQWPQAFGKAGAPHASAVGGQPQSPLCWWFGGHAGSWVLPAPCLAAGSPASWRAGVWGTQPHTDAAQLPHSPAPTCGGGAGECSPLGHNNSGYIATR